LALSKNELSSKNLFAFVNNISNVNLLHLDISKNSLGNEGMRILADLLGTNYGRSRLSIALNHLNLSNNRISSVGFEYFCGEMSSNKTLESLLLDDNPLCEGDRFFNIKYFLSKNWRLRVLSLANVSSQEKDIRCLCESL
jgi:hypothetical protein